MNSACKAEGHFGCFVKEFVYRPHMLMLVRFFLVLFVSCLRYHVERWLVILWGRLYPQKFDLFVFVFFSKQMKCFVSMSTLLIAVLGCYCQKDNFQALRLIPASEKINLNLIEWILVAGRARREKLGNDCLPSQKCPANNTCCYVSSTKFRCCPLKDAVCCADHTCCPGGYRCTETICKKNH